MNHVRLGVAGFFQSLGLSYATFSMGGSFLDMHTRSR